MAHDVYISVDVETNGTVPGDASMVQLGACVAAELAGDKFEVPAERLTYSADVLEDPDFGSDPATVKWLKENHKPFPWLSPILPERAMRRFREWVQYVGEQHGGARPVYVAYPLAFDWSFTHFYFEHYLGAKMDPFGFSSALCMKSMYAAKARCTIDQATKGKMPAAVSKVKTKHTHNALDDAIGQAELFANIWRWEGR